MSDRKQTESTLAEMLINVYEKSNPQLNFGECQNQLAALEWTSQIIEKLKQNEREAKRNGR